MTRTASWLLSLGVLLFVGVLLSQDLPAIFATLGHAGWGLLLVALFHLLPLVIDAAAIYVLIERGPSGGRLRDSLLARWVGESANSLMPAGQIGGPVLMARHLAVPDLHHVHLLEVDLPPRGGDRLIELAVLEADERAGVAALHAQPHPDLAVAVGKSEDREAQIAEGRAHPRARSEGSGRSWDRAGGRCHRSLAIAVIRRDNFGREGGISGLQDAEEGGGSFTCVHVFVLSGPRPRPSGPFPTAGSIIRRSGFSRRPTLARGRPG